MAHLSPLEKLKGRRGLTQARCLLCNVRHVWPVGKPAGVEQPCPVCGLGMYRTTREFRGPVIDWPQGLGVKPGVAVALQEVTHG